MILKRDGWKPYHGELPVRLFPLYRENQTFSQIHRLISQEIVREGETFQLVSKDLGRFDRYTISLAYPYEGPSHTLIFQKIQAKPCPYCVFCAYM
ncbi:hypothetical protein B1B00_16980 [Bacillus sp. DSM 27956]|nr:hypothetical protein B1B00_16980 [Bacillus sp. DSM 27956]